MALVVRLRTLAGDVREIGVSAGMLVDPDSLTPEPCVDTTRWTAMAGMADCHAHFAASSMEGLIDGSAEADVDLMTRNGERKLRAGVLLAADKGAKSDDTLRYLEVPEERRPDLDMAGGIIATPGGYYPGFAVEPTEEALPSVVDVRASTTAQWVKLIGDWPRRGEGPLPNFSEAGLRRAVDVAHAREKRVAVHTLAPDTPGMAVRAGVDSIEHGLFMEDTDVDLLGARNGAWIPTIAAMEALVQALGADSSGGRLLSEGLGRVRDLLGSAPGRGVTVLAGTDLAVPHGRVAVEAERMVAFGMDPGDAVEAMTTAAYRYLGRAEPLTAGAAADAVWVDGDPREDITMLQRPRAVMRRGRFVLGDPR